MNPLRKLLSSITQLLLVLSWSSFAVSAEISTNAAAFSNSPSWLTASRVNRVVDQIQRYLEWDIRKVQVIWYYDQASFEKLHGYDSSVLAVSRKTDNSIHVGPRITTTNFDAVFGHELVHIILFQKYREAIPKWLEEGLANFIAKQGRVDYLWLSSQPIREIHSLIHPFQSPSKDTTPTSVSVRYHYQASTALIEMIASKCSLNDLLQLSVGEKLEGYLTTFCGIEDLNDEFKKWLKKKSR